MSDRHQVPSNNFSQVTSLDSSVREIFHKVDPDEAFWLADMNRPRESLSMWEERLPAIKLFYAMKCCDEPNLLRLIADHGCGFDCASKDEIARILALGVTPDRIVFSHPIKSRESLRFAKSIESSDSFTTPSKSSTKSCDIFLKPKCSSG
jgi:ornithine decarboxylase